MNSRKRINLLRFRELEVFWNLDVAKVDAELVAPDRNPPDVAQRHPVGQLQLHVALPISMDDAGLTSFVAQPRGPFVANPRPVADVKVGGYATTASDWRW